MNALLVRSVLGLFLVAGAMAVPGVHAAGLVVTRAAAAPAGFDPGSVARLEARLNRSMRAEVLRQLRVNVRAMLPESTAGIAAEQGRRRRLQTPLPARPEVAQCGAGAAGRFSATC
jgi:hypothetical protein